MKDFWQERFHDGWLVMGSLIGLVCGLAGAPFPMRSPG